MFTFKIPSKIALPAALAGSLLLAGCFDAGITGPSDDDTLHALDRPVNTEPSSDETIHTLDRPVPSFASHVEVAVLVGSAKDQPDAPPRSLTKLVITLTSYSDTISDTLTCLTTPALDPLATTAQNYNRRFTLSARTWKASAKTLDGDDNVVEADSTAPFTLNAGATGQVSLTLGNAQ